MVDGRTTDHRPVSQETGPIRVTVHLWIGETLFDVTEVERDAVLGMPWLKQANPLIRWKTNEIFLPDQMMPILIDTGHLDQQLLF